MSAGANAKAPYNNSRPLHALHIMWWGSLAALLVFGLFGWRQTSMGMNATTTMNPKSQLLPESNKAESASLEEKIRKAVADVMHKEKELLLRENFFHLEIERTIQEVVQTMLQSQPGTGRFKSNFPPIARINDLIQKRILVTGGAGFVGSHLVDRLMRQGHVVIVLDNLFTGKRSNIEQWIGHPNFEFQVGDVIHPFEREVDQIYHLACPASPPHYQFNPIKTIKTSTLGTLNMLGLAKRVHATILLASTSEIYGDPEVHPQKESYWGNVNTLGPRSCYDEGKRAAETMMYSYNLQENVDIRIARIFNTFGPRMNLQDGRVVSNFIIEALQTKDLTVYGGGTQTRSFQYVDDLVTGLIALMNSNTTLPVNLGNPEEFRIIDFAEKIIQLTQSHSKLKNLPGTEDDPKRRQPDITRAKELLGWRPQVTVDEGLMRTIAYFKTELEKVGDVAPVKPPK